MRNLILAFTIIHVLMVSHAVAQETTEEVPATLESQYEMMIDNSETFQQYKVIPITKMNTFKQSLLDSLNRYNATIENVRDEKGAVEENNDSLQQQLAEVNIELTETQKLVDGIEVFGTTMTKTAYNITMWSVVVGLLALLVFLYLAFLNANRVAKQAKNDKLRVDDELEELRKTAHEKQVKVKRELQTALNKIDEMTK